MDVDVAAVLRMLAHELRGPASVIQGYVHMLGDRRLDDEARAQALVQVSKAAGRIARLGGEACDVAKLLDTQPVQAERIAARTAVEQAVAALEPGSHITIDVPAHIDCDAHDRQALVGALATLFQVVAREALGADLHVAGRVVRPGPFMDIVITTQDRLAHLEDAFAGPGAPHTTVLDLVRGGFGLAPVLAGMVFELQGARLWTIHGWRDLSGVRLPAIESRAA